MGFEPESTLEPVDELRQAALGGGGGVGGSEWGEGGEVMPVGCQGGSAGGVGERGGLCDVEEIREVERAEAEALQTPGGFEYVTLEDSPAIRDILSNLDHYGVARNLWTHSPKTRNEYSCLTYLIIPINRLPLE